jgi:hypothetical protein
MKSKGRENGQLPVDLLCDACIMALVSQMDAHGIRLMALRGTGYFHFGVHTLITRGVRPACLIQPIVSVLCIVIMVTQSLCFTKSYDTLDRGLALKVRAS